MAVRPADEKSRVAADLKRTECRGSHWRTDHPGRNDDEWLVHSLASYDCEGPPHLEYGEVIITRYPPTERKY